jgi:diguanylate cyclase (GGDEF)-like protein
VKEGGIEDLVRLSFFAEIGVAISSARTIKEIISRVMDKIGEIFAPQYWSILLLDRRTDQLYFRLVNGTDGARLKDVRISKGDGIAGWVAQTGQSAIVEDVRRDSRFSERMDKITGFTTRSIIAVPLKTERGLIGVIELVNTISSRPFTPLEMKLLTTIADFAAIALEKAYYSRALRRIAAVDALTGVYNRRAFQRAFDREVARCRRYKSPLSVLLVDIDDFKAVNDRFGHAAGDTVLRRLAGALTTCTRGTDFVARFGGDEFVVLMPSTRRDEAENAKARITLHLQESARTGGELPFTVSIGLHSAGPDTVDTLLQGSDMDLYREKGRRDEKAFEKIDELFQDMLDYEEGDGGPAQQKG